MRLLSRIAKPWVATRAYEWAESFDLIWERITKHDRRWLTPFEPPTCTGFTVLDQCLDHTQVNEAFNLLSRYRGEIKRLPPALSLNCFIGPADTAFYWSFIRSRRPDTIIEIGSGYSSRVAQRALERNQHGRLICIDPAPRLNLPMQNLTHIRGKIEDIDLTLFDCLRPQDILFIDSSHTGDEARSHTAILDNLPAGVLVHYHDIDYPWERQWPEWDEDSVIAEYLDTRTSWKVIVSGSKLSRDYLSHLHDTIPTYRFTPFRRYNALWMIQTT